MRTAARRHLLRSCHAIARRACLAAGLWLALPVAGDAADITSARYTQPTTRYAHGVLGDAVEWGGLELTLSDGQRLEATLPQSLVFEDLAPRLADLDGDGDMEVITVESSLRKGARLAIWDDTGRLDATPHIGRSNRWLAPVGAADLDGDGMVELAYVDRPHLAKTLTLWRWTNGGLQKAATLPGVSNHQIGWDAIPGGIRSCGAKPEMILSDAQWSDVVSVTWDGIGFQTQRLARFQGPGSLNEALTCP
jgi:hypothetical protein